MLCIYVRILVHGHRCHIQTHLHPGLVGSLIEERFLKYTVVNRASAQKDSFNQSAVYPFCYTILFTWFRDCMLMPNSFLLEVVFKPSGCVRCEAPSKILHSPSLSVQRTFNLCPLDFSMLENYQRLQICMCLRG